MCIGFDMATSAQARRTSIEILRFSGLVALGWVALYVVDRALPFVRTGFRIVYGAKVEEERSGRLWPASVPASRRAVIFGNSKVLSGFLPARFDHAIEREARLQVESYNMGLPNEQHFVDDLERLVQAGQSPRRVFLTVVPSESDKPISPFRFVPDDEAVIDRVFPFRRLPKDAVLFATMAGRRGGFSAFYRYGEATVERMRRNRGYYFIEGQSHYANDRIPDDLRIEADRPQIVAQRSILTSSREFQRLNRLGEKCGLRYYIVPSYFREGEFADPPRENAGLRKALRPYPLFQVVGPDYLRLPNHCFSDPVHLNPEGAQIYTDSLANLIAPVLRGQSGSYR